MVRTGSVWRNSMAVALPDHWVGGGGVDPEFRPQTVGQGRGEEEGGALEAQLAAPVGIEGAMGAEPVVRVVPVAWLCTCGLRRLPF